MLPRPRFRLPLWSVPVIVAVLYVARSLVRRSWAPELPTDVLVLALTGVVIALVARLRAVASETDAEQDAQDVRGASRNDADGPTD